MRKKIAMFGLGAVMMLSLAACGDKKDDDKKTEATTVATTEATTEAGSEKETEATTQEAETTEKKDDTTEKKDDTTEASSEDTTEKKDDTTEASSEGTTETASEDNSGLFTADDTDRVRIELRDCGANFYKVDILWKDTANTYYDWYFEGTMDENGWINYDNCAKLICVIDEEGNYVEDSEGNMTPHALYSEGSGKLHRVLDTIEWIDDQEDAGNGLVFRKLSNEIPEQE